MNDVFHEWGSDLSVGTRGDLALVTGSDVINQRICRRLLTNAGDYLWNLNFGGGLAQYVGEPADPVDIEAVVRAQLTLEAATTSVLAPEVNVEVLNPASGYVVATITYADPDTALPVQVNVSTGYKA